MWEAGYSTDNTVRCISIGAEFSRVCDLYVMLFFWLRSYYKTGVGCDNCTWPLSLTQIDSLMNLTQASFTENGVLI